MSNEARLGPHGPREARKPWGDAFVFLATGALDTILLVSLSLVLSCAAPRPPAALARAERLERAGHIDEAATAYDEALAGCARPSVCAEYSFRKGQLLETAGRAQDAMKEYLGVERHYPGTSMAARALGRAALLFQDRGEEEQAYATCGRILAQYPDSTEADAALLCFLRRWPEGNQRLTELGKLHLRLRGRLVDDNILFAAAELAESLAESLGDEELALRLYAELAKTYPRSSLADDAWWRSGELHHRRGRHRDAIDAYFQIVRTRRDAILIGSYHSEYLDDALLRIGLLHLDGLSEPREAQRFLRELRDTLETSTLRDDAQFHLARSYLEIDDRAAACRELTSLVSRFPSSNQLRRATELASTIGCR